MRWRLILGVSVGLNVLVVAFWLVSIRRPAQNSGPSLNIQPISNRVLTRVVVRKQFFSWQELESADYQTYINNLREIGCPEQTIRDIIVEDVNQLFMRRRWAEVPTPEQQWWRANPDTNALAAATAKLAELDQQRRALLTTLLGPNWETTDAPPASAVMLNGPILGDLSPELKNTVQDIVTRAQQRTQAYLDAQKAAGKQPERGELYRLEQQARGELSQVLTVPQLEEFLLRYSQTAATLRNELRGVDVTPDEFRSLFRTSDPIEQQMELADPDTSNGAAQQASLARQLENILKDMLGPDRYQEYRMSQDSSYRDAVNLADDAGAPASVVPKLYELNKAFAQEQNRIKNDPTLSDDDKAAQLQALAKQQQDASDQVLGLAPAIAADNTPQAPTPPPPVAIHSYSPGETVDQIATQYGVSTASILAANPNVNFNGLSKGTQIAIPAKQ
jgi:LysM repeat protein